MSASAQPPQRGARRRRRIWALPSAALLGAAAALLVSCGTTGSAKLIPAAEAGPLQNDFEEVAAAAQSGNGNCAGTEAALAKTEHHFRALPGTLDTGLREKLREGIENLRRQALGACAQPQTASTGTTAKTTPTATSTETTTTTTPTTSETTPTTPPSTSTSTTPSQTPTGGGTAAPPHEEAPSAGVTPGGGTGAGEESNGNGGGR